MAGAAVLPALAVPAVALGVTCDPDPIYAAIKACVEAERADAEAISQLEEARKRFKDKYGFYEPDAICKEIREAWATQKELVDISTAPCSSHEIVDKVVDSFTREDLDEIRAYLHKELDRQTAAYDETIKPFEGANTEAWERFDEAFTTLLTTEPTTPAGLAAMLACLRDNAPVREQLGSNYDNIDNFVATIASAVAQFVAQGRLAVQS